MSREQWREKDRECPPCEDCGEALYEEFWGNGGWQKTSVATLKPHSDRNCIANLKANLAAALGEPPTQSDRAANLIAQLDPVDELHIAAIDTIIDCAQNDSPDGDGDGSISEAHWCRLRDLRYAARGYNDALRAVRGPW